jgi:type I restriction enzyme S subunit
VSRWPVIPLGELTSTVTKGTTPQTLGRQYTAEGFPFLRVENLQGGRVVIDDDTLRIDSETHHLLARSVVRPNDVLLSIAGTIGRAAIVSDDAPEMNCNQAVAIVRLNPEQILPAFLLLWLKTIDAQAQMTGAQVTQTISNLSLGQIKKLQLPVPPPEEQKRIVKLLDEADKLRKLRVQADHRSSELIPALFNDAFRDPKFKPVRLGELTSLVTSGSTPRGGDEIYLNEGPYFIRSQNVQMNYLDLSDAACLPTEVHEQMTRTKVASGDVLLNITGASIGRVAWVEELDREANVSQHVCLLRPKRDLLDATYLSVYISLPTTQRFILQVQAGASRQALNHQQVRALEIPLPPLPSQKEFAKQVTEIRKLEVSQAASHKRLESLFYSMLHRAFRGEL